MNGHKPRSGRPGREPVEGERVGLSLRVTPRTKRALDAAAEDNGKSLSQEAEARLEQSFRDEGLLPQILDGAYGRQTSGLLLLLGWLIRRIADVATGLSFAAGRPHVDILDDWMEHPWTAHQVAEAIRLIVDGLDPGEVPPPALPEGAPINTETGRTMAYILMLAVRDPRSHEQLGRAMNPIRERMAADGSRGEGNAG
jgi:hypothetical protein